MSCATATRWFVEDPEYYAKESDYALVDNSEKLIRREIDEGNDEPRPTLEDGSLPTITFGAYLGGKRFAPLLCYDFARPRRMLWADVDDEKPEQRNEVNKAMAEHAKLDQDEQQKALWKELIPYLAPSYDSDYDDDDEKTDTEKQESKEENDAQQEKRALRRFNGMNDDGELDWRLLDILLKHFKEPEKTQRLVNMITGGIKRPLMVLVGMVDDMRNPNPGEKSGYAIGYDLVKDLFICKPFFSDKNHHPLASSWYPDFPAKYPDDHVNFALPTKDFIAEFLKKSDELTERLESGVIKELQPAETEKDYGHGPYLDLSNDRGYPYILLAMVITAKFIDSHWDGLVMSDTNAAEEKTKVLYHKFGEARKNIKDALRKMRVPVVAKTKKEDQKVCLCAVEEIEWQLEEQEDYFRRCAVMAKEQGHEKIAVNAAKLYEKVMGMLRAFNEDPEREV